jgi:periplasmic protein CpxP/Spy
MLLTAIWAMVASGTTASLAIAQVAAPLSGAQVGPDRSPNKRGGFNRPLDDRINAVIRKRLQLTDEQFTRLRAVARRMENERRMLRIDEGSTRASLRRELLAGEDANDSTVAAMLDRLPSIDRRRIDLMEREQSELAKFLSPVQRAKYIGLQDELRRSMEELQYRRANGGVVDGDSVGGGRAGLRRPFRPPVRR